MIYIQRFGKVVLLLSLFSVFTKFFGCERKENLKRHSVSEITSVSISCNNMNHRYSYFFYLYQKDNKWLFDTDCFTHNHDIQTIFEGREVNSDNIDILIGIIENKNLISYAENYKKPPKSPYIIMDETIYIFSLTFSDKSQYITYNRCSELEEFFYSLTENLD